MVVANRKQNESKDSFFRKFGRAMMEENLVDEVRKRQYYKKPSLKKKEEEKERMITRSRRRRQATRTYVRKPFRKTI